MMFAGYTLIIVSLFIHVVCVENPPHKFSLEQPKWFTAIETSRWAVGFCGVLLFVTGLVVR